MEATTIFLTANKSTVLLSKITTVMRQCYVKPDSFNAVNKNDTTQNIIIIFAPKNENQLNLLMNSLRNVIEVQNVKILKSENSIQLEAFIIKTKSQPMIDSSIISRVVQQDYGYIIYGCSNSSTINDLIKDLGNDVIEIGRSGVTVLENPLVKKSPQVYNKPPEQTQPKPVPQINI